MGFADVWNRTLVYFGIAEEDDWDEDGYATNEVLQRSYAPRERANVRRLRQAQGLTSGELARSAGISAAIRASRAKTASTSSA